MSTAKHPAVRRAEELRGAAHARASGSIGVGAVSGNWRNMVASDATAADLMGPANTANEVAAVASQLRYFAGNPAFTHWWDPALASAWIAKAVELTSDRTRAGLERASYADQCAAVRAAWGALSNAYRALNIPWMIDPAARDMYTSRTSAGDTHSWCESRVDPNTAAADQGHPTVWGLASRALRPGPYQGTEDTFGPCVRIHNRITLSNTCEVQDYLHNSEEDRDYWPRWGVLPEGQLNVFNWYAFAWHDECTFRPGPGDCRRWESELFPPLIWYFELARDIARSLAGRGPLRVVVESFRCAFVLNVKTAAALGTLRTKLGPDAYAALVGASDVTFAQAHMPNETVDTVANKIKALGDWVEGTGIPGLSDLAGGIIGAVGSFLKFLNDAIPPAVQVDRDAWGRDRPVFEASFLTGGLALNAPPTHHVDEPEGWVRPVLAETDAGDHLRPPPRALGFGLAPGAALEGGDDAGPAVVRGGDKVVTTRHAKASVMKDDGTWDTTPPAEHLSTSQQPPKRSYLPWILGGALLLFALAAASSGGKPSEPRKPSEPPAVAA